MRISDWSSDVCSSDLYNSRSRLDGRRTPGIHMARYQPLSAPAQTAYAQLLDAVHGAELARSVANLAGTFPRKQVKDKTYWYFQSPEGLGRRRRPYCGWGISAVLGLVKSQPHGGQRR